jgi:hypothetical protein
MQKKITINFAQSEGPIDAAQFSHFLYLFTAAYTHSLSILPSSNDITFDSEAMDVNFLRSKFTAISPLTVSNLFFKDMQGQNLQILALEKHSPLTATVKGALTALIAAAILSGGEVDLKNLKFSLPPIGVGIRSLRDALQQQPSNLERRHLEDRNEPHDQDE